MEPLLKGPAGQDYLKNAFANRHGSPSDAYSSLPRAVQWLSSVLSCKEPEWEEHINSLSALDRESSSHGLIPSTILRSGGTFVVKPNLASLTPGANTTTGLDANSFFEIKEKVQLQFGIHSFLIICSVLLR